MPGLLRMGVVNNLYSVEDVSAALLEAGSLAFSSGDDSEIIRGHLLPLVKLLQMNCAVLYAGPSPPIQVKAPRRKELQVPKQINPATEDFIAQAEHQLVTSEDPIFTMGHLRNMSVISAASSMWIAVPGKTGGFGVIALFDQSAREFPEVERSIVRTFAQQLGQILDTRQPAAVVEPIQEESASSDLSHYIESSRLMGGVSRDLINPLTAMLGYIELMRGEKLEAQALHFLEKLRQQAEKLQEMIMALNSAVPQHSAVHLPATSVGTKPAASPRLKVENRTVQQIAIPRARVLVIQKNEATLEFKKSVLAALTADVVTSFNGLEAIQLLKSEDLHAVILDDELDGEWPGRRLFGWICENKPELAKRVLLTISSHPKPEIMEMIEETNVAHVSKPLQMVELFAGIQQILGAGQKNPPRLN